MTVTKYPGALAGATGAKTPSLKMAGTRTVAPQSRASKPISSPFVWRLRTPRVGGIA